MYVPEIFATSTRLPAVRPVADEILLKCFEVAASIPSKMSVVPASEVLPTVAVMISALPEAVGGAWAKSEIKIDHHPLEMMCHRATGPQFHRPGPLSANR